MACSGEGGRRPDVVLIVVDTLRADAVHDPDGRYDTPAIDRLARDGVLFEQALAHAPMTLPSHTSLFSSRPPLETRVVNNGQEVPGDLPMLPDWMRQFGYESRAVTSLGTLLPLSPRQPGLKRAFDEYFTDYWNLEPADRAFEAMRASLDARQPDRPLFFFAHFCDPHEPYDTHAPSESFVEVTIDGVELTTIPSDNMEVWEEVISLPPGQHQFEFLSNAPFRIRYFRCLKGDVELEPTWLQEPGKVGRAKRMSLGHDDAEPTDCTIRLWVADSVPLEEMRRRYVAEVEYVDRHIGLLIDELEARGMYDESLVIFTSDHGEAMGEQGHIGHVQNLTQDQIGVPLIIKPPHGTRGRKAKKLDKRRLARHVDLTPTILDLVGIPELPGQKGSSLFRRPEGEILHLAETHKPEARADKVSLFDGRYKMIYTIDDDSFRMFDLENDPKERRDVFGTHAALRPDWEEQLRELGRISTSMTRKDGDLDAELERQLRALGYGE